MEPLDAATLVLLRDQESPGSNSIEVLMQRRSSALAFAPGKFVFPGGALEPADYEVASDESFLTQSSTDGLDTHEATLVRASIVAAIRECFEEVGVLAALEIPIRPLDWYNASVSTTKVTLPQVRRLLQAREIKFVEFLRANLLSIQFDRVGYFSRWVTPEDSTRRFDTRFFMARFPEGQTEQPDGVEAVSCSWFCPTDALIQFQAGEIDLMLPTIKTLEQLSKFGTVQDALEYSKSIREVAPVRPSSISLETIAEFNT